MPQYLCTGQKTLNGGARSGVSQPSKGERKESAVNLQPPVEVKHVQEKPPAKPPDIAVETKKIEESKPSGSHNYLVFRSPAREQSTSC